MGKLRDHMVQEMRVRDFSLRTIFANRRLLFVGDGIVRLVWKDYADHNTPKEMTLPAAEFLRRFLLHVVPRGFMRIRHYGIVANRHRAQKLRRCRELLGVPTRLPPQEPLTMPDRDPHRDASDDFETERTAAAVFHLLCTQACRRAPRAATVGHLMSQTALPLSARRLSDDHAGGHALVRAQSPATPIRPCGQTRRRVRKSFLTAPDTAAFVCHAQPGCDRSSIGSSTLVVRGSVQRGLSAIRPVGLGFDTVALVRPDGGKTL